MNVCKCKLIFPTDTLQQLNFLLSFFIIVIGIHIHFYKLVLYSVETQTTTQCLIIYPQSPEVKANRCLPMRAVVGIIIATDLDPGSLQNLSEMLSGLH